MKFEKYLNEDVIIVSEKLIDEIVEKFAEVTLKYKNKIFNPSNKNLFIFPEIAKLENKWNKIGKKYKIRFMFLNTNRGTYNSIFNATTDYTGDASIEIIFNQGLFTSLFYYPENALVWKNILNDLRTVLYHEMIHREQYFKRKNVDLEILRREQSALIKKYSDNIYYYHQYDEIMAHAKTAIDQFKFSGLNNYEIKRLLRNPTSRDEIKYAHVSSYWDFKKALKNDNKNWKLFQKYLYMYLDKTLDEDYLTAKQYNNPIEVLINPSSKEMRQLGPVVKFIWNYRTDKLYVWDAQEPLHHQDVFEKFLLPTDEEYLIIGIGEAIGTKIKWDTRYNDIWYGSKANKQKAKFLIVCD